MRIAICAGLEFTHEIKKIAEQLTQQGHKVIIPKTSEMILNGEVTLEQIKQEKESGEIANRAKKYNVIKYYFGKIKDTDAILILNYDKRGIKNYIGGNVFLEIGFAHVLGKKIFLLNDVPNISYKDEIESMNPIILRGNLSKIK